MPKASKPDPCSRRIATLGLAVSERRFDSFVAKGRMDSAGLKVRL